jgi:hypothetical protein
MANLNAGSNFYELSFNETYEVNAYLKARVCKSASLIAELT